MTIGSLHGGLTKQKISWKKYLNWQDTFTGMVKGKVTVIKCWKNLHNALDRFLKLKNSIFLKWQNKRENIGTAPKTYRTIINHLLDNIEIPAISPLIADENFVCDFNKKANLFNNLFASICTPIKNASNLSYSPYITDSRISSFHATEKEILLIIKSLDPTKAHGCDNSSVRMIKICNESIIIPLKNNFKELLRNGVFLEIWKRANVVPAQRKEDKSLVKKLLPYLFTFLSLKE